MNPNLSPSDTTVISMHAEEDDDVIKHTRHEVKSHTSMEWHCCGYSLPKDEIVFFVQICPLYIVIICAIANLTLQRGEAQTWILLLGSCLGYLLPNPTLPKKKRK